jgi:hypothetical protein
MEIREELDRFEYFFVDLLTRARNTISESTESRRLQRDSQQMRTRIIEGMHAMSASDDSVVAFFDTWGLVIRLRNYLDQGAGRQLYGDHQKLAVETMKTAEEEIIRIGRMFLKPEQFEDARQGLESFARQYAITGTYSNLVVYATQEQEREAGALMRTLSIPMAPIRAMEGVDNTANAIHRVRDSVERFTDVAQQLPESTRWQMTMLMDDFEEAKMTQSFLSSLEQFSNSGAQLVETLNAMPAQLRAELLTVLEESDQTQQKLQTTMKTATQAAVQIEKTLGELQTTSGAINETATQATEAAVAWENASDSIQALVMLFKTRTPRPPDAPPPFGMRDFDNMLTNAARTADQVTNTVAQIQQAIDSGANTGIQKELRSLVDHIALRLFQLILAAFGLMLVYRVIKRKLRAKQ